MSSEFYGIDFGTTSTFLAHSQSVGPIELIPLGASNQDVFLESIAGFDDVKFHAGLAIKPTMRRVRSPKSYISICNKKIENNRGYPSNPQDPKVRALLSDIAWTGLDLEQVDEFGQSFSLEVIRKATVAVLSEVMSLALAKGHDLKNKEVSFACPSLWNGDQRKFLVECIREAGFTKVTLQLTRDEAVTGSLETLGNATIENPETVVVFDVGGGTTDVAVLEAVNCQPDGQSMRNYQVTTFASHGNLSAGDEVDRKLAKIAAARFHELGIDLGIDEDEDSSVPHWLLEIVKKAKETATSFYERGEGDSALTEPRPETGGKSVSITVQDVKDSFDSVLIGADSLIKQLLAYSVVANPKGFLVEQVKRQAELQGNDVVKAVAEFEKELQTPTSSHLEFVTRAEAVRDGVPYLASKVSRVLLVGGMARLTYVEDFLRRIFPNAEIVQSQHPMEMIARGLVTQVLPFDLNAFRPPFEIVLSGSRGGQEIDGLSIFKAYDSFLEHQDKDSVSSGFGAYWEYQGEVENARIEFLDPDTRKPVRIVLLPDDKEYESLYDEWRQVKGSNSFYEWLELRPENIDILSSNRHVPHKGSERLEGTSVSVSVTKDQPIQVKVYATGLIFIRDSNSVEIPLSVRWPESWHRQASSAKKQIRVLATRGSSLRDGTNLGLWKS